MDEELEKLTNAIQKSLKDNPVFLIGSGASIAYGLPSMNTLSDHLVAKLSPLHYGKVTWQSFVNALKKHQNLEEALQNVELGDDLHREIITETWRCIENEDRGAIRRFFENGTQPAFTKILRKFVETTGSTDIVTTNYDRLIEYAIEIAEGEINTGFSGTYAGKFDLKPATAGRKVNLYKVHGSVDWFRHKINKNLVSSSFQPDLSCFDPMIVTPGLGKYRETHEDPFRTVIAKADEALKKAKSYLCLGYGFNNEHIQTIIIEENRAKKKPVVIVTKAHTEKIAEIFFSDAAGPFLIISENATGGTDVVYKKDDRIILSGKNYWQLDEFYELWF